MSSFSTVAHNGVNLARRANIPRINGVSNAARRGRAGGRDRTCLQPLLYRLLSCLYFRLPVLHPASQYTEAKTKRTVGNIKTRLVSTLL